MLTSINSRAEEFPTQIRCRYSVYLQGTPRRSQLQFMSKDKIAKDHSSCAAFFSGVSKA